jgi:riboflavin synthase
VVIKIFTGIVEETGTIASINRGANSIQLEIAAGKVLEETKIGDSIAVDGVCLTVTRFAAGSFVADVMPETMDKTTLKLLQPGSRVNLERALRLSDRLGGHLVQGHVDGKGIITAREKRDIAIIYKIKAPEEVLKYTIAKGSVAIDGISLTVIDVTRDYFTVSLIPHTAHLTTLGDKNTGDQVNLESDLIGRYVEKLLQSGQGESANKGLNMNLLSEHGFL